MVPPFPGPEGEASVTSAESRASLGRVSNRSKKAHWVREAVAITDALVKNAQGRYLCPLCLQWFSDLDDLSLEHAPPQSVGGRHVAVTCRECNSRSGHTADAELRRVETVREFGTRTMTRPMAATFRFGDVELRGSAIFTEDGLSLMGVPEQNHPDMTAAMTAALRGAADDGATDWTAGLSFPSPDFKAASVAWLRAGYLVAFATLGYLYILREELEPVREQIQDPKADVLGRYCLMTHSDQTERLIAFIRDPPELESVIVLSNASAVLLPSHTTTGTYERLANVTPWPPGTQTLTGPSAPWPQRPSYAQDRVALGGACVPE